VKVLHVMNDSVPLIGGYTTRSRNIVVHQKRMGIEPFVLTSVRQGPTEKEIEYFDDIPYFRTQRPKTGFLRKSPLLGIFKELYQLHIRIREISYKIAPDVIHAHSPILCAIPALSAGKIRGVPLVYEIRAFWEDAAVASGKFKEDSFQYRSIRLLETLVCKRVDRIVSISRRMKKDLTYRGIPDDKLLVVPNGVDIEHVALKGENDGLSRRLGLYGRTVLGYLGTFYDFEGIDVLLEAFAILSKTHNKVSLLLIGGGEMEKSIKDQISRLNLPDVVLLPKVPLNSVNEYYALMDMVIYARKSSRITNLTTPLKPLEAMALGKPVICSSVGGLKELVGPGNGVFFTPGNSIELVNCCEFLMENPKMAKQLGTRGRKRALEKRNWEDLVTRYLSLYESLVDRQPH
jgi:PEP-CTERM/exosortase A-associated glycosyltransferase